MKKYYGWCVISNNGMEVEAETQEEAEKKLIEITKEYIIKNDCCTHLEIECISEDKK